MKTQYTNNKVVAVSGGFDPLHIGHARMFAAAKELGDRLVVIVNNDNWLRAKKGYAFMPEEERVELIRHLSPVDEVIVTSHTENDPDMSVCRELRLLKPHIFANGGDRKEHNTPEGVVCQECDIEMIFNIGAGGKVQSSSWVTLDALEAIKTWERPWGAYKNHHTIPDEMHLKTLHLAPGAILSLQRHKKRSETWLLVQGDAMAEYGDTLHALKCTPLKKDVPFRVPVGTIHRLTSEKGGVIVEIMYGTYEEDDIERFDDVYGRL